MTGKDYEPLNATRQKMTEAFQRESNMSSSSGISALHRCVGDTDEFLCNFWDQAPFLYAYDQSFADLLSLADVDHMISSTFLRWPAFRLVRADVPLDPSSYTKTLRLAGVSLYDVADPGRIFSEFQDGASIVLQGLHRSWSPVTTFCRELETLLTHPVQANAYITPPHSQGLPIHYDTHDVFVLQTTGTKQWEVYERIMDRPLSSQRFSPQHSPAVESKGQPRVEVELQAGHCLYVPRGYLHQAMSTDQVSIHLAIAVSSYTWSDVLWEVFRKTADEVTFRGALPIGFADDEAGFAEQIRQQLELLQRWLDNVELDELAQLMARKFWSTRPPLLAGQLQQLLQLERLTDDTLVVRRRHCIVRLELPRGDGDTLTVILGDRQLEMPLSLEPTMRAMLNTSRFRVRDLSEHLDKDSRLMIVRRFIREGLLEMIDE